MDVRERAKLDLENGDHWLARTRLKSYLSTNGYDPELLKEIGQISYDMHDAYDAGRMWLLSTAEGSQVDEAIKKFMDHLGGDPQKCVSELPSVVRLKSIDQYPTDVQDRIRIHGLEKCVTSTFREQQIKEHQKTTWGGYLLMLIGIIFLLFVGSCSVAGCYQIGNWLFE